MTRKRRLLLGLGCVWPLVYVLVVLVIPYTRQFLSGLGWTALRHSLSIAGVASFLVECATLCLVAAMVTVCVTHVSEAKHVDEDHRVPWTLLLVLANVISLPVYWYVYVWRAKDHIDPRDLYPNQH